MLVYLGTGAFSEGYAPGALTTGTRLVAPWAAVQVARSEANRVFLSLDPGLTPLNRLELINFSSGEVVDEREVARQRLLVRLASGGASGISLLVAALTVERVSPRAGAPTAIALGLLTAGIVFVTGLWASSQVNRVRDGAAIQAALLGELALYLPHLVISQRAPAPPPVPFSFPNLEGFIPRTTLAMALTLAALLLGGVLTANWVLEGDRVRSAQSRLAMQEKASAQSRSTGDYLPAAATPRPTPSTTTQVSTPEAPAPASETELRKTGQSCRCDRSDSLLWASPVPKLATLILGKRMFREREGEKARERAKLEVSVAVVNGGAQEAKEIAVAVQFFERDPPPSSKRYSVATRAMYYEGPLGPGQAVKWTVEARGTEFELQAPETGHISEGAEDAAPANLVAELLHANHRPVRMHGAMLLAFLGDARAREGALKLKEALREDEAPYLERVLDATSEARICRLKVTRAGAQARVSGCLFNSAKEARADLGLGVRALAGAPDLTQPTSAPPDMLVEHAWHLQGSLGPQSGAEVEGIFSLGEDASTRAIAFEGRSDRWDLLNR